MPANDLRDPLKSKARRAPRSLPSLSMPLVSAALLLAALIAVWVAVVDDPDGGRSVAVASIEDAVPESTGSLAGASGTEAPAAEPAPAGGDQLALAMPPPMSFGAGALPQLVEQSAYGPLPRVSPDGTRAREAYARRGSVIVPGSKNVVIVVGGLGLSQTGTQSAIEALPEDVTLAFAPYGSSLQRWVDKARAEGHEVLLQIPLEPGGYPQENPGEHTLLVSADGRSNRDDLHWNLGRMTSYAGVMNYMGSRFSGNENALVPFLGEIGERGLFYLDDGTTPMSMAASVGTALRVPVITADLIVDADRSPDGIRRSLAQLESIAVTRGVAVGVASAFPESVNAIADWAREAQSRGVVLVPASAALGH